MIIHLRNKNADVEDPPQKILKENAQPRIQRKDSKEDDDIMSKNKGHPPEKEKRSSAKSRGGGFFTTCLIIIAAFTSLVVHYETWSSNPLEMATTTATATLSTIRNYTDTSTTLSRSPSSSTATSSIPRSADPHVFDVMIGTAGRAIQRQADILITFDPGDGLKKEATLESYPFAIADYDGTAEFWANDDFPECNSMNYIHGGNELGHDHVTELQEWYRTWKGSQCSSQVYQNRALKFAFRCIFPQKTHYVKDIPVRRLSSVLRERGVVKINKLQIDAQGSDFAILKEVLENYGAYVSIEQIVLECQYYDGDDSGSSRTDVRPLYYASNDCRQIKNYIQMKYPKKAVTIREEINNCAIMEYNLYFDFHNK